MLSFFLDKFLIIEYLTNKKTLKKKTFHRFQLDTKNKVHKHQLAIYLKLY
jgi:hypothetical protein